MKPPARKLIVYLALFLCALLFMSSSSASPSSGLRQHKPVVLTAHTKYVSLNPYMRVYEDKSAKLNLQEVLQKQEEFVHPPSNKIPSFGFTKSAVWVNVKFVRAEVADRWLLHYGFSLADELTFYEVQDGEIIQEIYTGDSYPFATRPILNHDFLFKLQGKVGQPTDVYVRLASSDILVLPFHIWEEDEFEKTERIDKLFTGIYSGMIILMFVFTLFLYGSFRVPLYFHYAIYIFCLYLTYLGMTGEAFQYFWPDSPWWAKHSRLFFTNIAVAGALLFIRDFLNLEEKMPRLAKWMGYFVIAVLIHSLTTFAGFFTFSIQVNLIFASSASVIALSTGSIMLYRGYRPARFFLLGWTVLTVGLILYTLSSLRLIPWVFLLRDVLRFGSGLEALVLLFALTDRFNQVQKERYQAQQAILKSKDVMIEKLHHMDEQKNNFLSNMSHELLTPLNGMLGLSEVLEEMIESKEAKEYLQIIQTSGRRLVNVFQSVLRISSLNIKGLKGQEKDFSLLGLVQAQVGLFLASAKEKGISLDFYVAAELPNALYGNENGIAQILNHLISNGIKFTEKGGVMITLRGKKLDLEQWELEIKVQDTGIGFPVDEFELMCNSFTQNDPTSTRKYDGCGLGLSIVKKLTDQMEGEFTVKNVENGTLFLVRIVVGSSIESNPPVNGDAGLYL